MSTTFEHSPAALADMEMMHNEEKFLKADEKELLYVNEADDNGEDRTVYGWGPCCPVELREGVNMCKSF